MTRKEELFIQELLAAKGNATEAYRRTHPKASQATAEVNGYKLLKKPRVAAALAVETRKQFERIQMSGDEALAGVSRVARADIRLLFDARGALRPMHEWPDDVALVVKSIAETKYGKKLELYDKLDALKTMAKVAGRLKETVVVERTLEDILAEVNTLERERAAS